MSTSVLYHTNAINDVQYKATRYEKGSVIFEAEMKKGCHLCPKCKNLHSYVKEHKQRKFRMVPFGNKACFLSLLMHRFQCSKCDHKWWPRLTFMVGKKRMTRSFIKHILDLMAFGTVKDVSSFLGVSWDTVKDIHKEALKKKYKSIHYKELRYIGIDEFSIRKGHEYMTIFTNLESGEIIHAVEGRDKEVVLPFLKKIARKAINLRAIAMDMSKSYISAVREILPKKDIVFDHFHVTALINRAIDEFRREQQRKSNEVGLKIIKGFRFLLLRNYESLESDKKSSLEYLFEVNKPIATMHQMKEQFRLYWSKKSKKEGAHFLGWWIIEAMESNIGSLTKLARSLLSHWEGLITYFDHKISNGITEGINNKIKTLKRQAYGYRDMEYFKLRLYHLHKQKSSLTG